MTEPAQSQPAFSAESASVPASTERPAAATAQLVMVDPAELEQLRSKAALADEHWDKFLRAAAELDNYRKRVAREKEELLRFAVERVVAELLPVLDNFERALAAAEQQAGSADPLLAGLKQIHNQLRRTLEQHGLQEVVAEAGQAFDPNQHEAVGHEESEQHPEGAILQQLQRGYRLANRLLRPARVVVSKGPPAHP